MRIRNEPKRGPDRRRTGPKSPTRQRGHSTATVIAQKLQPVGGWLGAIGFFAAVGLAIWLGGFLAFADRIGDLEPTGTEQADGIVALTGGRERIKGAIDLLQAGKGRRLLISGVHPGTRSQDLERVDEASADLLACCIDLGREAETTIGNAREAADWARRNGFRSLIVVTSAYHLPRSLTEFALAMPDIALLPYPIHHLDLDLKHWYLHSDAAKLLIGEYVKYTLARMRALMLPMVPA